MAIQREILNLPESVQQQRLGELAAAGELAKIAAGAHGLGEMLINGAMAGEQPSEG